MKITKYLLFVATLFIAVGCYEFDEYKSEGSAAASAPSLTMVASLGSNIDSTIVAAFTSTKDGYISYALMADSVIMEAQDLMEKNVADALVLDQVKSASGVTYSIEFKDLQPNTEYYIYSVASTDGFWSEISADLVQTDDNQLPTYKSSTPEVSDEASVDSAMAITLEFSEPISYVSGKKFTFSYLIEGVDIVVPEDSIEVDGKSITIKQSYPAQTGEYFALSWEEGAVIDMAGNECIARVSGLDANNALTGNYYRTVLSTFSLIENAVLPEPNSGQANLDSIILKFGSAVSLSDEYSAGDMKLIVSAEDKSTYYDVPLNSISTSDSIAIVYISTVATVNPGEVISIEFAEGAFIDTYENTVAAYPGVDEDGEDKESIWWLKSYGYTRDLIAGTYTANCTSHWGGDTTFTLTISEQLESTDTVYIVGLAGTPDSVKAVFDGVLGTIEFGEQFISIPNSDKSYVVSNGYVSTYINSGTVSSNGNMTVTWGVYNLTDSGWWDLYPNSSWVKQ